MSSPAAASPPEGFRSPGRGRKFAPVSAGAAPDIVCFSGGLERGPRAVDQVVRQLAREHRVLWVNVPGPLPRGPRARAGRGPWAGVAAAAPRLRRLAPDLHALAPLRLPAVGARARRLDRALLRWQVARAMRRLGLRRPVVWAFVPGAAPVVGALGEALVVYHLLDEAAADGAAAGPLERDLLRRADLVLVASEGLLAARRRQHRRVVLVRADTWAARVTLMRAHVAALLDGRAAGRAPAARGGTDACRAP